MWNDDLVAMTATCQYCWRFIIKVIINKFSLSNKSPNEQGCAVHHKLQICVFAADIRVSKYGQNNYNCCGWICEQKQIFVI